MTNNLYSQLYDAHQQLQRAKPLVLNLSNYVTQDFIANVLLALGCAPIMSESDEELAELATLAHSLNLNIGTLDNQFAHRAINAGKLMQQQDKCVVLDPVGAGATCSRTRLAQELLPLANIIRGNASEIMVLTSSTISNYGVESSIESLSAMLNAQNLARQAQKIIVVSGKIDLICSPDTNYQNKFGTSLMTKVTGMGCCLSAVIAGFAAVCKDYALASYLAVVYYTLCAEQAARDESAPASFKVRFIDCIYRPDWAWFESRIGYILQMEDAKC